MPSFPDGAADAILWSDHHIAVQVEGPDGACSEFLVNRPFARVGRDQRCDVPLSESSLLPCHLYLHATEDGVYFVSLDDNWSSGWLLPSDEVKVGPFRLRATVVGLKCEQPPLHDLQAKESESSLCPQLRVFAGAHGNTDIRLPRRLTLLGRESPATRRIKHATISRVHCAMFWNGQELWLVDLFSSNGTRLRGQRFEAGRLATGSEFRLGAVRIKYLGNQETAGVALDPPHSQAAVEPIENAPDSGEVPLSGSTVLRQDSVEARLTALEQRALGMLEEHSRRQPLLAEQFERLHVALEGLQQQTSRLEGSLDERLRLQSDRHEDLRSELTNGAEQRLAKWAQQAAHDRDALAGQLQNERDAIQNELQAERLAFQERLSLVRDELLSQMASMRQESQAASQELQALAQDVAAAKQMLATVQAETNTSSRRRKTAGEAERASQESLREIEVRWNGIVDGLNRRTHDLEQQIKASHQQRDAADSLATQRHDELGQELQDFRRQLGAVKEELATAFDGVRQQAESAGQTIGKLRDDLATTHAALAALQTEDVQFAEQVKRDLRETAEQLRQEQQVLTTQTTAVREEIQAEVRPLAAEVEVARQDLRRLAADVLPTQQALAELKQAIAHLQQEALPGAEARHEERLAEVAGRYDERLREVGAEVANRMVGLEHQLTQNQQDSADKLAGLEGTLTAKIAILQGTLDTLRQQMERRSSEPQPDVLERVEQPVIRLPCGPREDTAFPLEPEGDRSEIFAATIPSLSEFASQVAERRCERVSAAGQEAELASGPEWVINDAMTKRMLDFKAIKERTVLKRRLLWAAVAAVLMFVIASAAGTMRLWLNQRAAAESTDADVTPPSGDSVHDAPVQRLSRHTAN
jgi:hypothetical protein